MTIGDGFNLALGFVAGLAALVVLLPLAGAVLLGLFACILAIFR